MNIVLAVIILLPLLYVAITYLSRLVRTRR